MTTQTQMTVIGGKNLPNFNILYLFFKQTKKGEKKQIIVYHE